VASKSCSHVSLLGELDFSNSLSAGHHVLVLDTHDTTAPGSAELVVVIEESLEGLAEGLEVLEVFLVDFGQGNAGSGLGVDQLSEVGLAAHEAVWDSLLSAESREVHDQLNGVDVMGDDDELGLVLLNEGSDVVEAELEVDGLGGLGSGTVLGSILEAELLLLSGLGRVFGKQFKELGSLIFVDSLLELVDCGGHLQALHKNSLLSLDTNVLGPLHKASQVSLWLDVSSNSKVTRALREQRTLGTVTTAASTTGAHDNLLAFDSFLHHYD